MDKKTILDPIAKARQAGPKRGFNQTFDLIINLKNIDINNPNEKIDMFVQLPYARSKKAQICGLVDESLVLDAKKVCDYVITKEQFSEMAKKKREMKKIASKFDYFVTQPHLMPEIAATLGKILGPKGKMPNPKSGCILPPKAALQPIVDKLRKTIRLITKNDKAIKCPVGDENMKDEHVAENIATVYNAVIAVLPQQTRNIKSILLKTTMGAPVRVGENA